MKCGDIQQWSKSKVPREKNKTVVEQTENATKVRRRTGAMG